MSWFSIANSLAANEANLELSEHQQSLGTTVRDLSTGLRINSAADDPSGNAITTSLQTHAQGFSTASQNVANALNAAAVADGALASVTDILLRIRELAVGAASSVDSSSDRLNIQAEINQLLSEVNRISQDTNFNGRSLLDGSIAGFQPAQFAHTVIESNSILMGSTAPGSQMLLASTGVYSSAIEPAIVFNVTQNVTAASTAQTITVNNAAYIQPGSTLSLDGQIITVQSVNAAAGTITAIIPVNVTDGDVASALMSPTTTLLSAVAAGTQLATLSSPDVLYAGEVLQINPGNAATNDVVVVQQVLSSTTFIATFNKAQAAGTQVTNDNATIIPPHFGPGIYSYSNAPSATDGAPIGSTAYVIEIPGKGGGGFPPPNGTDAQIVATGTVVGGGLNSTEVQFNQLIPDPAGGIFELVTPVGLGTIPVVNSVDGTIKLSVVNQSGTVGVQETFYDTATHASITSPTLLSPGERSMLLDGVVTTLGNFDSTDVGSTAYIKVLQSVAAITSTSNPALTVQSAADEGDIVQIAIPAVNTNTLRVSAVTVIGASGTDPTLASEDTIGQLDYALGQVNSVRAQLGAQIVRLGIDGTNDDTAATELTASQSTIADLDVGAASTEFTQEQLAVSLTTSLLAQVNDLRKDILKLFDT